MPRQIVGKLLAEKISFAPEDRNGERGFRFEATGTVEKLVTGAISRFSQAMVPQRDSNPCCSIQETTEWNFRSHETGHRRGQPRIRSPLGS